MRSREDIQEEVAESNAEETKAMSERESVLSILAKFSVALSIFILGMVLIMVAVEIRDLQRRIAVLEQKR